MSGQPHPPPTNHGASTEAPEGAAHGTGPGPARPSAASPSSVTLHGSSRLALDPEPTMLSYPPPARDTLLDVAAVTDGDCWDGEPAREASEAQPAEQRLDAVGDDVTQVEVAPPTRDDLAKPAELVDRRGATATAVAPAGAWGFLDKETEIQGAPGPRLLHGARSPAPPLRRARRNSGYRPPTPTPFGLSPPSGSGTADAAASAKVTPDKLRPRAATAEGAARVVTPGAIASVAEERAEERGTGRLPTPPRVPTLIGLSSVAPTVRDRPRSDRPPAGTNGLSPRVDAGVEVGDGPNPPASPCDGTAPTVASALAYVAALPSTPAPPAWAPPAPGSAAPASRTAGSVADPPMGPAPATPAIAMPAIAMPAIAMPAIAMPAIATPAIATPAAGSAPPSAMLGSPDLPGALLAPSAIAAAVPGWSATQATAATELLPATSLPATSALGAASSDGHGPITGAPMAAVAAPPAVAALPAASLLASHDLFSEHETPCESSVDGIAPYGVDRFSVYAEQRRRAGRHVIAAKELPTLPIKRMPIAPVALAVGALGLVVALGFAVPMAIGAGQAMWSRLTEADDPGTSPIGAEPTAGAIPDTAQVGAETAATEPTSAHADRLPASGGATGDSPAQVGELDSPPQPSAVQRLAASPNGEAVAEPDAELEALVASGNADALVAAGDQALAQDRASMARARYRAALAIDANDNHAMAGLAEVALAEGDAPTALAFAQDAVRRRPRRAAYRVILGDALMADGHRAAARQQWRRALRLDRSRTDARQRLARR